MIVDCQAKRQRERETLPGTLLRNSMVPLRIDHFLPLKRLSSKVEKLYQNQVEKGEYCLGVLKRDLGLKVD